MPFVSILQQLATTYILNSPEHNVKQKVQKWLCRERVKTSEYGKIRWLQKKLFWKLLLFQYNSLEKNWNN